MADTPSFTQLVPGFEFLQNLVKNAGSAMPAMGQWIAPTLNPEEIEKRISELRTVQFWLEQNARMIATTVQALEVQRMTLSTLQTMNVQMGDLRESLQARATPPAAPAFGSAPPAASAESARSEPPAAASTVPGGPAAAMVDPVQWWGALTKQFTELAASALQEPAAAPTGEPAAAGPDAEDPTDAAGKAAGRPRRPVPKR